jgi:hypothetical protein
LAARPDAQPGPPFFSKRGTQVSGSEKVTGFLSRFGSRRAPDTEVAPEHDNVQSDVVVGTKALKKFIAYLSTRPSPVLIDLGPVVGSNINFFGEQIGCKIFVEDIFGDLDRHEREGIVEQFPAFLRKRFPQATGSVDGILCWDLFDFLDRASAQAVSAELSRLLAPNGALFGFFGMAKPTEGRLTKYVVVDDSNLRHRPYSKPRPRQAVLQNRDITRLFEPLRVSDSFLLKNNVREILFRKPEYFTGS